MRVRTGRFVKLWSRLEPRQPQAVEVSRGQDGVEVEPRGAPPPASIGGDGCRHEDGGSAGSQFAEDRPTPFPMLQVDGPEPVADRGCARTRWRRPRTSR